jgi:hypothetical protein
LLGLNNGGYFTAEHIKLTEEIIMTIQTSYKDFVDELFEKIEAEIFDLNTLIEIEYYENPNRYQKLVRFENECVEEFKKLQENDWDYLSTEDPDIDYECAELTTRIYALKHKLESKRPSY